MKIFLPILFFSTLLYSCSKDAKEISVVRPAGCDSLTISYSQDVKRIISFSCSGATCHSGGNSNYDFSTYDVLADRIRQGKVVYRLLLPLDDPQHMPEKSSLSDCDLHKIVEWINEGYPNN